MSSLPECSTLGTAEEGDQEAVQLEGRKNIRNFTEHHTVMHFKRNSKDKTDTHTSLN